LGQQGNVDVKTNFKEKHNFKEQKNQNKKQNQNKNIRLRDDRVKDEVLIETKEFIARPRHNWENGMTDEEILRADRKEKQLEQEAKENLKKNMEKEKIKKRFHSRVRFWFDEYSYVIYRDMLLIPGEKILGDKVHMSLVGLYLGMYVGLAFLLGRIWSFLVPMLYLFTFYVDQDESAIAKCLFGIWFVTKIIKAIFLKTPKQTHYEAMMYAPQKATDWYSIGRGMGFYVDIAIMIGLTYLVHGNGYGQMFHGVWVMANILIISRNIPGVGGNSNLGLITLVFIALIALMMLPDIYAKVLRITVRTLEPVKMAEESIGVSAPIGGLIGGFSNPFEPIFGLASTSFLDAFRAGCGNFVTGWMICDDWLGAGYALSTATTIRMKTKDEKLSGTAGLYGGLTVFWVLGDLFLSFRSGAVLRVIITIISIVLSAIAWFQFGSRVWGGRGQGVMLTEARPNFGFVFGNGPIGMRIAVLRLCTFVATMCFMTKTSGNLALGAFLMMLITSTSERAMTILLGGLTMQLTLVIQGFTRVKPVTESLSNATVDAYSSLGENSSRTEPG
jgi:hypothetical protein